MISERFYTELKLPISGHRCRVSKLPLPFNLGAKSPVKQASYFLPLETQQLSFGLFMFCAHLVLQNQKLKTYFLNVTLEFSKKTFSNATLEFGNVRL